MRTLICLFLFTATLTAHRGLPSYTSGLVDYQVWVIAGQSLVAGSTGVTYTVTGNVDKSVIHQSFPDWTIANPWSDSATADDIFTADGSSWGPEVGFARWLVQNGEKNVVVIKVAQGSHSIENFLDSPRQLNAAAGGTDMYERLHVTVDAGLAKLRQRGNTATLRGFVWFQGRANQNDATRATNYGTHLERLITDVRSELDGGSVPNLPWITVVSPTWANASGDGSRLATVQGYQRSVTAATNSAVSVESDSPLGTAIVFSDGTHPDSASTERIGRVAAQSFIDNF